MWDLPKPEIEPMFLALGGGFLTTEPLGKSLSFFQLDSLGNIYSVFNSPVSAQNRVPSQRQFQRYWMWTCTLRTKETKFLLSSQPINMDPPTLHLRKVAFLTLGNQAWGEAGKFPGFQHRFRVKIQGKKEKARLRQLWNQLSPLWRKWIWQFMLHFSLQGVLETVFIKPRYMYF